MVGHANVPADAVQLKAKGFTLGASKHGIDMLAWTWKYTLDWCAAHPFLFCAVLIFLGFWIWQRRGRAVDRRRMRQEYDATRLANQTPPLPLPPPPQKPKIGSLPP